MDKFTFLITTIQTPLYNLISVNALSFNHIYSSTYVHMYVYHSHFIISF